MTTRCLDGMVDEYLARLDVALGGVPDRRRRQLVEEVGAQIDAARLDLPAQSEAGVRTVLADIGRPETVAAEELSFHPWSSRRSRLRRGAAAVIALTVVAAGSVTVVASTRTAGGRGRGPLTVAVPDVVGLTTSSAVSALRAAHLSRVRVQTVVDASTPPGTVAAEHPGAGTEVHPGSSVTIEVSYGQ